VSETGPASGPAAAAKEAVGRHAATLVTDGMRVGLGTGSTAYYAITALAERHADIRCIGTSEKTEALARERGLTVVDPAEVKELDLAIDGADEIDPVWNLIKGGGGALTREKVVAEMAREFVVVVDDSKPVECLGAFGLPFEVVDFAVAPVTRRLQALGARSVEEREQRSDNDNALLDANFGPITDPGGLAPKLAAIPGVIEHGIFPAELVGRVLVGGADGVTEPERREHDR